MSDLREIEAAMTGIRRVSTLPIIATMTFDTNRRTMMGVTPAQAAKRLAELEADVIGANCGNGVDDLVWAVGEMRSAAPTATLFAKSNAGVPRYEAGGFTYDGTPEVMADYARRVKALGVQIIGACCGSTPAHIHAIGDAAQPA
jgi:5-methyltetrahydrofolate--homocysteine methyltransferase